MKGNKYFNEPQSQKWRERQEDSDNDSIYYKDRASRREVKRRVKSFGLQVKMFIEAAWWDSFEEHQQEDIFNDFYSARSSYYYNSKQTLDLKTWIGEIYRTRKPNMANYRGSKLDDVLK